MSQLSLTNSSRMRKWLFSLCHCVKPRFVGHIRMCNSGFSILDATLFIISMEQTSNIKCCSSLLMGISVAGDPYACPSPITIYIIILHPDDVCM